MAGEPRAPYTVVALDDIDDVPALGGALRWKPVRRTLGVGAFGVNAYAADAGQEIVEDHTELKNGHQELYVVLRGRARFKLDGTDHDAPAGTLVFAADPGVRRHARAEEDGTLVLAMGADPAQPYRVSNWEHSFFADAQSSAGDHDAAIATMEAARESASGDMGFHYNLACFLARAGRHDEAIAELRRAAEADGATAAEWARDDADLTELRARPDWPLGG